MSAVLFEPGEGIARKRRCRRHQIGQLICCQEIRVTAEVRPTDAPRGPSDRSATYYGSRPCSREAHAPQDNCVHKSSVNYGNLRCHFQDRASASIHICPAVRGHLPGGLWCRYWPDSGDFRELRASIGPQCLRRNGFNRGSSNLVGERIEPGGHRQRSPNSAAGPTKAAFTTFAALTRARGAPIPGSSEAERPARAAW